MEFVREATAVTDERRARLAAHFTPQEVTEIVLVIGFWKMYNLMHRAINVPIEDPVMGYTQLRELPKGSRRVTCSAVRYNMLEGASLWPWKRLTLICAPDWLPYWIGWLTTRRS